jgi:uncharacterized protein YutE (UPF0331/DUF86 family)
MEYKERIALQIKSLLIMHFISKFAKLENLIKNIFQDRIQNKEHQYKSKLYFMYGCMVGNDIYYDIENECLSLNGVRKYNNNELFKNLNINRIIRFDRKEKLIDTFSFNVNSIQKRALSHNFHDCILALISMRNKLAHELDKVSFKDTDVIEILSSSNLNAFSFEWLEGLDITHMSNDSIKIFSNLVYIDIIINELKQRSAVSF